MTVSAFLDGRVTLHCGDCLSVLAGMDENSVDSVVCDPPYHLTSIVKRFGATSQADDTETSERARTGADGMARLSRGFMGKTWDGGDVAFRIETWVAVLRVIKPGAYLIAFSGTRTYHRMAVAIEDAGFEVRDQIGWLYGAGFPKSLNVSKALDEARCKCTRPQVSGSVLQHGMRPVRRADVPKAQRPPEERREVLLEGVSEQSSSGSVLRAQSWQGPTDGEKPSMEGRGDVSQAARELRLGEVRAVPGAPDHDGSQGRLRDGASVGDGGVGRSSTDSAGNGASPGSSATEQPEVELGAVAHEPGSQAGGVWPLCGGCGKPVIPDGLGTALKPAWEPIMLARKPLDGTNAENMRKWGTAGLNIDGCRVGKTKNVPASPRGPQDRIFGAYGAQTGEESGHNPNVGRWPANIIHDGSAEVLAAFPESSVTGDRSDTSRAAPVVGTSWLSDNHKSVEHLDSGSAARFFYTAKADAEDRLGSKHPTVKPLDLMQYLVRLVTPPGGLVLDCFAGTGTTGEAAFREGMRAVLIEREPEYQADIARRMELAENPNKRAAVAKSKNNLQGAEGTPLFGDEAA